MRPSRVRRVAPVALLLALAACSGGHPSSAPTSVPASQSVTTPSAPSSPAPTHLVVHETRVRLPFPVAREALVPLGRGRYLSAGGLVAGDSSTDQAFVLDTHALTTAAAPAMQVPVHDTAGVLLGGRPLVVGGGNSTEQDVVQARVGTGWQVIGHLPQPRSDLSVAVLGSRVLALGGYDGSTTAMPQILASVDGRRWRPIGTLPVPVRYAAVAVAQGHVWLFGGERAGVEQRAVQEVDAAGHARVVARLPVPLGHGAAIPIGGRILLAGGRLGPDQPTDRMWWFDPHTRRFTPAGHLPVPLADAAVALDGDRAWLVGGETPGLTDRVLSLSLR